MSVVPKFFGSPWDTEASRPLTSAGSTPRVGVYCPHRRRPWLLGCFTASAEAEQQMGYRVWGWDLDFVTGDDFLIHLQRQSDRPGAQYLVDDEIYDSSAEMALMRSAMDAGDWSTATSISQAVDRSQSLLRMRVPIRCGEPGCKLARVYRSNTVQPVVTMLWDAGISEISLAHFMESVSLYAANAGSS